MLLTENLVAKGGAECLREFGFSSVSSSSRAEFLARRKGSALSVRVLADLAEGQVLPIGVTRGLARVAMFRASPPYRPHSPDFLVRNHPCTVSEIGLGSHSRSGTAA